MESDSGDDWTISGSGSSTLASWLSRSDLTSREYSSSSSSFVSCFNSGESLVNQPKLTSSKTEPGPGTGSTDVYLSLELQGVLDFLTPSEAESVYKQLKPVPATAGLVPTGTKTSRESNPTPATGEGPADIGTSSTSSGGNSCVKKTEPKLFLTATDTVNASPRMSDEYEFSSGLKQPHPIRTETWRGRRPLFTKTSRESSSSSYESSYSSRSGGCSAYSEASSITSASPDRNDTETSSTEPDSGKIPPNQTARVPPDSELIVKNWRHPYGKKFPAVVITMNHFIRSGDIFIPCEIAMSAFTVLRGLISGYCTLVDPVNIPVENEAEAMSNADKFGLPQVPFSERFSDYEKIVSGIESFIQDFTGRQKPYAPFVFCLADDIKAVQGGLEWLYNKVGEKFRYKLFPLEGLLVTLTIGGLDYLEVDHKFEWRFPDILDMFKSAALTPPGNGRESALRDKFQAFSRIVSGLPEASYKSIGKYGRTRVAFLKQFEHPYAMLGGFLLREHVTDYLSQSVFLHLEEMACHFHKGEVGFKSRPKWKPVDRVESCALSRLRNQLYLALDAMLPNYKIEARTGFHYPKGKPPKKGIKRLRFVN